MPLLFLTQHESCLTRQSDRMASECNGVLTKLSWDLCHFMTDALQFATRECSDIFEDDFDFWLLQNDKILMKWRAIDISDDCLEFLPQHYPIRNHIKLLKEYFAYMNMDAKRIKDSWDVVFSFLEVDQDDKDAVHNFVD